MAKFSQTVATIGQCHGILMYEKEQSGKNPKQRIDGYVVGIVLWGQLVRALFSNDTHTRVPAPPPPAIQTLNGFPGIIIWVANLLVRGHIHTSIQPLH